VSIKSAVRKYTPRSIWSAASAAKSTLLDIVSPQQGLAPPRSMNFVGSGDFRVIGQEFLGHLQNLCQLKPSERVLDLGCGIGRMAIPLTQYLTAGSYEGIDIVPQGIEWCKKNITPRFPRFQFHLADIRNREYNPHGPIEAAHYILPFLDSSFDVAFLTSVFTHMTQRDIENYMRELRRVLRPSGRLLSTWFALNQESENLISSGKSAINAIYPVGFSKTSNANIPEEAIAHPEPFITRVHTENGLVIKSTHYGSWCGRSSFLSMQDIYVASQS